MYIYARIIGGTFKDNLALALKTKCNIFTRLSKYDKLGIPVLFFGKRF